LGYVFEPKIESWLFRPKELLNMPNYFKKKQKNLRMANLPLCHHFGKLWHKRILADPHQNHEPVYLLFSRKFLFVAKMVNHS